MGSEATQEQALPAGFIARQAVFDEKRAVWGYKLFYRHSLDSESATAEDQRTLLEIATNSFLSPQWQQSPSSYLLVALESWLFDEAGECILPRGRTVLELREKRLLEPEVRQLLVRLRQQRYLICVNDFTGTVADQDALQMADILAVDMRREDRRELIARATAFDKTRGVRIFARKVEDAALFEEARSLGCTLFQGFFFQKPEQVGTKSLPASLLGGLDILKLVEQSDPDLKELAAAIQKDVALSLRLLKFLNSPYFGFTREVSSIKLALILAGWEQMRTWLRLVLLSGMAPKNKPGELVFLSAQRARFLELAGSRACARGCAEDPDRLLLLGLFSLLDSIFDMPMADIVGPLPLPAVLKDTLCRRQTPLLPWLELVDAFERADWEGLATRFGVLGLDPVEAAACYTRSMQWAHAVFSNLA